MARLRHNGQDQSRHILYAYGMVAPEDGLLPLDEAAARARISKRKLQRWLAEGHLQKRTRRGDQRTFVDAAELLTALRTVPHQRRRRP